MRRPPLLAPAPADPRPAGKFQKLMASNLDATKDDSLPLGSFYVVVRVRPESERERGTSGHRLVVQPVNDHVLVFDPRPPDARPHTPGDRSHRDARFVFDRVFDPASTNADVYADTAQRLINPLLQGFSCCLFAYGATGSGKSHTMSGADASGPGLMQRTVLDLFRRIADTRARDPGRAVRVVASYLEIYNENIRDLLAPRGGAPLNLREDPVQGPTVQGLLELEVTSAREALNLIDRAGAAKAQSATAENAQSSRSHGILQLRVEQQNARGCGAGCGAGADAPAGGAAPQTIAAKLSLVDLAGSERAKRTEATGVRFLEGANINKSLLALGNCINALCRAATARQAMQLCGGAAASSTATFVPYRNSKLTRLLKDSLGGDAKTVMVSTVSPALWAYDDTLNTLSYANRAKEIKVCAKANATAQRYTAAEYTRMVADLTSECGKLRAEVAALRRGAPGLGGAGAGAEAGAPSGARTAACTAAGAGTGAWTGAWASQALGDSQLSASLTAPPPPHAFNIADLSVFQTARQNIAATIRLMAAETKRLSDHQCERKRINVALAKYATHEGAILAAMENGLALAAGMDERIYTLEYKTELTARAAQLRAAEARTLAKLQGYKEQLLALKAGVGRISSGALRDALADLLAYAPYQARHIVAESLAALRLEIMGAMSDELDAALHAVGAGIEPVVRRLHRLARADAAADADAHLRAYYEARFGCDALSANYFSGGPDAGSEPPPKMAPPRTGAGLLGASRAGAGASASVAADVDVDVAASFSVREAAHAHAPPPANPYAGARAEDLRASPHDDAVYMLSRQAATRPPPSQPHAHARTHTQLQQADLSASRVGAASARSAAPLSASVGAPRQLGAHGAPRGTRLAAASAAVTAVTVSGTAAAPRGLSATARAERPGLLGPRLAAAKPRPALSRYSSDMRSLRALERELTGRPDRRPRASKSVRFDESSS